MWECLEVGKVMMGVVGYGVVVETGRMSCVHVCVPACLGQVGEVDVVEYWVWRAVVLTGVLSDGWKEE